MATQSSRFDSITPMVGFTPSKAVFYTKFVRSAKWTSNDKFRYHNATTYFPDPNIFDADAIRVERNLIATPIIEATQIKPKTTPRDTSTNFEISHKANVNIKNRINWLFQLSKPKMKMSTSGKPVHNFKLSFITLTLPSQQVHPTATITSNCLNQWLVEMRKETLFNNYVWRLEFQKNGNVHYHIVTDTYIQWHHARNTWNRIINKLGYVQAYKDKFSGMTFQQYSNNTGVSSPKAYDIAKRRYAVGQSEQWKNPNTIDVKNISSNDNIAAYISKYVSKNGKQKTSSNPLDHADNSSNIRLWYCSKSLSRLKSARISLDLLGFDVLQFIKTQSKTFHASHDFCDVVYYEVSTALRPLVLFLEGIFENHAHKSNYIPSD